MARRSEADDRTVTAWWAESHPIPRSLRSPPEDPTVMASAEYQANAENAEYYPPRSGRVERPYDLQDSAVDELVGDLDLGTIDPYNERSSFAPPPIPADLAEHYFRPYEVEPETRVAIPALPSEDVIEDYEDYDLDYDTDPAATEEGTLFLVPPVHAPPPVSAPSPHAVVRGLALSVRQPPVAPPAPVSAPFVHPPVPQSYDPSFERFATTASSYPRRQHAPTVRTGHRPETKRGPLVAVSLVGFIATLATLIAGWQLASVPATPPSIVNAPIATVTSISPSVTTETAAPMIAVAPPAFEIADPAAAAPAPKPARVATKPATSAATPVARLSFSVPASPYGEAPPKSASKQKPKTAEEILEALGEEQLRR